jgi:hypothetical protein
MGNSLHDKIYLGRSTGFASRRFQGVLAVGALVGAGFAHLALKLALIGCRGASRRLP